MDNFKNEIKSEDRIKNIYGKILQLKSNLHLLECATNNEFELPNTEEIHNALGITIFFIDYLINDTKNYMDYLQKNNLYN